MYEIEVDLADDRFDVAYDRSLVSVETLLSTIRDLDYKPELVEAPIERTIVADRIDPSSLPDDLQALFAEAKAKSKSVLVEFSGPGWVSCQRMDTVTYPHPDVRAELSGWLERRADVTKEADLTALFEVVAIPTAILLDGEGRVLDRMIGFVNPEEFLARLSDARKGR